MPGIPEYILVQFTDLEVGLVAIKWNLMESDQIRHLVFTLPIIQKGSSERKKRKMEMMQSFGSIHPQLSQLPSQKKSSPRHGNKRGAGGAARTAHTAAGPFESGPERSAAVLGCSIANCHRATGSNATRAAPCAWLRANSARGAAHAGLEPDNAGTRRQRASIWNVSQRVSVTRSPRSEAPGQTRRAAGTRTAAQGINSGGRELRGMRRAGNGAGPRGVLPGRARKSGAARPASRSPPCPDGIPRGHRPGPAQSGASPGTGCRGSAKGPQRRQKMSEPRRCPTKGCAGPAAVHRGVGARGRLGDTRGTHSRGRRDTPEFCPLPPFADRPSATNPGPRRKPRPRPMGRRAAGRSAAIGRRRGRPAPSGGDGGLRACGSASCRPAAAGSHPRLSARGERCVAAGGARAR